MQGSTVECYVQQVYYVYIHDYLLACEIFMVRTLTLASLCTRETVLIHTVILDWHTEALYI